MPFYKVTITHTYEAVIDAPDRAQARDAIPAIGERLGEPVSKVGTVARHTVTLPEGVDPDWVIRHQYTLEEIGKGGE